MTIIEDVHLELSRCVDAVIELRRQNTVLLEALEEIASIPDDIDDRAALVCAMAVARWATSLARGESGFDTAQRVLENVRRR